MTRRDRALGFVVLVVVLLVGGVWFLNRPPVIPGGAAGTVLERTTVVDGHGGRCLDRRQLGAGWADVCWAVDQIPDGSDNTQDYFHLRVYGSFEGLKWLVARADLVGQPNSSAYVVWPRAPIEGGCRQVHVDLEPNIGVADAEDVCGHTEGDLEPVGWTQTLAWTCEQCLLPDAATKPLAMYSAIAVDAGTTPEWDLFVDGGS